MALLNGPTAHPKGPSQTSFSKAGGQAGVPRFPNYFFIACSLKYLLKKKKKIMAAS
jgi:hypothetical protein